MLGLKAKYSSRTLAFAALFIAAIIMLTIATSAIYSAVASPTSGWGMFQGFNQISDSEIPEPEQFRFRDDVDPQTAAVINAAVPDTVDPIAPATPFSLPSSTIALRTKMLAIDCLTAAIYYEAASESITGQRGVAQVVLNRVRHPAYANSVCGVVFQGSERQTGCQFSFTCDGSLARRPSKEGWSRAQAVAAIALSGYVEPSVGLATHYHTIWVVPYWSSSLTRLKTIGAHIFYRWAGRNGTLAAFTNRYSGVEQLPQTKLSAVSPITGGVAEDIAVQAAATVAAATEPANDTLFTTGPRETGLLITPQTRIRIDPHSAKNKIETVERNGLIIDKERVEAQPGNRSLMIDRK